MRMTKQGETLAGHIGNKEWENAHALVQEIHNVQTLVKSGWDLIWNNPDVPPAIVRFLLIKIKVLSRYQNRLYPVGLFPFMAQEKMGELLKNSTVTTIKAFFGALTDTYRGSMVVKWPQREALKGEIDALWTGFLRLPLWYSGISQGDPDSLAQLMSVRSLHDLEQFPELKALWHKTELLLKAALGIDLDSDDWRVLHAIAEMDCLSVIMLFALRLYPNEIYTCDSDGNTPLHIAVTKPIFPQKTINPTDDSRYNHFRTGYPEEIKQAQEFMAAFLLTKHPEGAKYVDATQRVPLLTSILSLPTQLRRTKQPNDHNVVSQAQLDHRLNKLIEAAPEALVSRDFTTRLYPFQMAASVDAPLKTIYTLLRSDPSALKYRMITKREADYERILIENDRLKRELQEKDELLQQLQSKLEQYEKRIDVEEECNGKRKRSRLAS